jgi:aromatic ring-opening dioxygenase LigB subunit
MQAAVLMCHAPIVIPAIGGRRGSDCIRTTEAMARAAAHVVAARPDWLVVLSPHTPRHRTHWVVVQGDTVGGSFAPFGHPELALRFPNAADRLATALEGIPLAGVTPQPLDHGALVPLWFLAQAGWSGPTAVLGVPWENTDAAAIGRALARSDAAVVASGDMSHRLLPGAPSGYHPQAQAFDHAFVDALRRGDVEAAVHPDPALRELAAEDVVDTTSVLRAALGPHLAVDVLSYEGPFGVGYCEAIFPVEAP